MKALYKIWSWFSQYTCPATGRPCPHPGDCDLVVCRGEALLLGRRV